MCIDKFLLSQKLILHFNGSIIWVLYSLESLCTQKEYITAVTFKIYSIMNIYNYVYLFVPQAITTSTFGVSQGRKEGSIAYFPPLQSQHSLLDVNNKQFH